MLWGDIPDTAFGQRSAHVGWVELAKPTKILVILIILTILIQKIFIPFSHSPMRSAPPHPSYFRMENRPLAGNAVHGQRGDRDQDRRLHGSFLRIPGV